MAGKQLFSPSWHRVATLRPRLVAGVSLQRHVYRGQVWYVLQNASGGQFHRLSSAAHALVERFDGQSTVQEIWEQACAGTHGLAGALARDIPTQNDVVDLLIQLHTAELLQVDISPDAATLFERYRKKKRQTIKQWLMSPTSIKVPLINPSRFLERTWQPLAWLLGPMGLLLWLLVVCSASVLALQHWKELSHDLSDQLLAGQNLLILMAVFPVVKTLHELGHAYATRIWGGEVHEMGLMFLVFAPSPYVDASASSSFRSKWRRAIVGAAGMLVETFVASLALFVWLSVEPGLTRTVAYNVMVIAGVSTVIFNGNPLLRYNGYYILTDLIEMPNLAQRGQKYWKYLVDRYLFGAKDQSSPPETAAEKRWLFAYTPLAWCYKVFVTLSIIAFIANQYFVIGAILALWSAIGLFGIPLWKAWKHVASSPSLHRRRRQAIQISLVMIIGLALGLGLIPLPLRTQAQGVIWLPEQALVRSRTEGFFVRWLTEPGQAVQPDAELAVLENPAVAAELATAEAKLAESKVRYQSVQFKEPSQADLARQEVLRDEEALLRARQRADQLVLQAQIPGQLTAGQPQDAPGRYYKRGELVAYVLDRQQLMARVVVPQNDIALVRDRLKGVRLRLADDMGHTWPSQVRRLHTGGIQELPSPALGIQGGGSFPTDPQDSQGLKTLNRVFWVDLQLPPELSVRDFGERVYVRFDLGGEPLLQQGVRRLRQLFLSRFGV